MPTLQLHISQSVRTSVALPDALGLLQPVDSLEDISCRSSSLGPTKHTAALSVVVLHIREVRIVLLHLLDGVVEDLGLHLQTEKSKFPESTHFIDGLIERMQK